MAKAHDKYLNKITRKKISNLYKALGELENKIDRLDSKGAKGSSIDKYIEIASCYEALSNELYFLRTNSKFPLNKIEDKIQHISQRIQFLKAAKNDKTSFYSEVTTKYRSLWRDHGQLFFLALFCFLISIVFGWAISYQFPEFSSIFMPEQTLESMASGHEWFKAIQSNPIFFGFSIAYNNIRVCILAYMLGVFFGVGGLTILVFNGAMVGVMVGASHQYAFSENINNFIASHGPLELTLIVASCFASFVYGQSFYKKPLKGIINRLKFTLKESLYILLPLTGWLCIAAMFEVFVSPFDYLNTSQKFISGLVIALIFWAWTFWPEKKKLTNK